MKKSRRESHVIVRKEPNKYFFGKDYSAYTRNGEEQSESFCLDKGLRYKWWCKQTSNSVGYYDYCCPLEFLQY